MKTERGDYAPAQALTMTTRRSRPHGRRGLLVDEDDQQRQLQHRVDVQLDDDEVPKPRHLRSFTHIRCTNVSRAPVQQSSGRRKTRTRNPAVRWRSKGGRTSSLTSSAPNKGSQGKGEERRGGENESNGWRKGWRGCLYIGGGGEALPLPQDDGRGRPRAAAAPTNPSWGAAP